MRRLIFAFAVAFLCRLASADDVWKPFVVRSFDGREMAAELAFLPVRENRSSADSRLIRVGVVRLPSSTPDRSGPPAVFLSGGPGIPATALARVPVYFDLFEKLRAVG